jgi:hypothetical protein
MEHVTIINTILDYFSGFSAKDIETVSKNFANEITLSDWNGSWTNRSVVKETISSIFNSVEHITISPRKISLSINEDSILATCEITILITQASKIESLKVIDLITLKTDQENRWKIHSISAYKQ